jgi:hypothetical protein
MVADRNAAASSGTSAVIVADRHSSLLKPITAENSVLVMVDYMTRLLLPVKSHTQEVIINNATALAKIGAVFDLPMLILGDEGPRYGTYEPTIHAPIAKGTKVLRHTVSAWREPEFVKQVEKTGRKNLIVAGISTDMCVAMLALDARRAGYDVTLVVDASCSQSLEMHQTGVTRLVEIGCVPTTWVALGAELLSDWRHDPQGKDIANVFSEHLFQL